MAKTYRRRLPDANTGAHRLAYVVKALASAAVTMTVSSVPTSTPFVPPSFRPAFVPDPNPRLRPREVLRLEHVEFGLEPSQHFGEPILPRTGPRALVLAVFEDGVRCLLAPRGGRAGVGAKREALQWLFANGDEPFQFKWSCLMLGFNPEAMRSALLARVREQ